MTTYLLLAVGLLVLVKGADIMISAASKIAKILKVPAFIVGLFIVAIGTSAPEAAIGVFSGIQGANLLTLGDVVGSSIVNITVILGLTALIFPIPVDSQVPRRELLLSILIQIVLTIMIFTSYTLSRLESVILLIGMFLFVSYITSKSVQLSKREKPDTRFEEAVFEYLEDQEVLADASDDASDEETTSTKEEKSEFMPKQAALFLIGLVGLVMGANLAVDSAVQIAHSLGWSEEFIGLTVVAFGTSLPELVACLIAAIKKEEDIALGNIIGSNIFNILFVLGVSGVLHPITAAGPDIFYDLLIMIGASVLLMVPAYFYGRLSKRTGFVFISYYIIFLAIKLSAL
ncbi:MAG: calcium/sodium antiporter [Bacillota bacterium]